MTLAMQASEWWSQSFGVHLGAYGGAGLGVLGGALGAAMGVLAPKGKGKTFILSTMGLLIATSVVLLLTGIIALIIGQPYHVWYGPMLIGFIGSVVLGSLFPVVVIRYRQAEARKMDAEAFKRS